MRITFNDRRVEVEIDHAADPCDSCARAGIYLDTDQALSDRELEELQVEAANEIYEDWNEHQISKADFYDCD